MRIRSLTVGVAAAALLLAPTAAVADSSGGQVTVVHGVPGLEVDVWANGDPLLQGFAPGTVTDPVDLPAGTYDLEIYPAGTDPEGNDPAIAGSAEVTDGLNASIAAHLDADGNPTLSVFANDTSSIEAGQARLTVRHTAAAGAVDILAGGDPLFEGVENPAEGVTTVPADSYDVAVNAAGTDTEVAAVPGFELAEGANTIVYAIGTPGEDFELLVQTISGLHSSPDGVPAGSAGLAASSGDALALTAGGLLALAGIALVARRRAAADA